MTNSGSSSPDFLQWLLTALAGLVTAGGSFWLTQINDQIGELQKESQAKAQAIASLEAYGKTNADRLDRIEVKIDRVLDRVNGAHR